VDVYLNENDPIRSNYSLRLLTCGPYAIVSVRAVFPAVKNNKNEFL